MYARASTHLIAPRPYVFEVASFTANYQPGSLFGINAIVEGNKTNQFINEMLNELQSIATTITDEEVYRAKQQLRRQLLSHYENAELLLTELVSSVNNFGKWKGPDYLHDIDKVSTAQVQQCAELLFDPAVALITTIGNPRQVSHQWYSREPDDPDQTPFTEQTLNAHLDSVYKPTKKTALDGLKALFRR
jgi:predicted Zn-dependent peptidase